MKRIHVLLLAAVFGFTTYSCSEGNASSNDEGKPKAEESKKKENKKDEKEDIKSIELGTTPETLENNVITLEGDEVVLSDYAEDNGLLVIFSCNTCPFVIAWENRYNDYHTLCRDAGIGMVLINSNEAFRNDEDSPDNMRKHAEEAGYTMPYVIDRDHMIADDFGAKTTPHVFLFDKDMKLRYKGAIDDNYKERDAVKSRYLHDAVIALTGDQKIDPASTKALGCSIKRLKN